MWHHLYNEASGNFRHFVRVEFFPTKFNPTLPLVIKFKGCLLGID